MFSSFYQNGCLVLKAIIEKSTECLLLYYVIKALWHRNILLYRIKSIIKNMAAHKAEQGLIVVARIMPTLVEFAAILQVVVAMTMNFCDD